MNSKFFNLNWNDVVKAAIVAGITAGVSSLISVLDNGGLPTLTQLKAAGVMAAIASVSYLLKNLLTNSTGQIAKTETK